jgi:regulator of replication initiation timing
MGMEGSTLETLVVQQLEENHKLLLENNFLLHKIIEQNHLIFTTTQKNMRYYSGSWLWSEGDEVKKLRKELNSLLKQIDEYKQTNKDE